MPLEHFQEIFMHFSVRGEHFLGPEAIRIAVKSSHFTTCLFQDDVPRRNIPWPYESLHAGFKAPGCNIADFCGGRAHKPQPSHMAVQVLYEAEGERAVVLCFIWEP